MQAKIASGRIWLAAILAAGIGASAAGLASSPAGAQGGVKVGELNSYSRFAAFAVPYRNGMQLAQDEIEFRTHAGTGGPHDSLGHLLQMEARTKSEYPDMPFVVKNGFSGRLSARPIRRTPGPQPSPGSNQRTGSGCAEGRSLADQ